MAHSRRDIHWVNPGKPDELRQMPNATSVERAGCLFLLGFLWWHCWWCCVPWQCGSTCLHSCVWLWSNPWWCRGRTNISAFVCGCLLTGGFAWRSHTSCSNTSRWTFSSHPLSLQIVWWLSLWWSMAQQGHTSRSFGSSRTYPWNPMEYSLQYQDI